MNKGIYSVQGICAVLCISMAGAIGCKFLKSEFPSQDVLACKAAVVAPYVGGIAEAVVAQAEGKSINFISVLLGLNVSPADVLKVVADYKKCGATNAIDEEQVTQLRMQVAAQ